jgi:drug/metabolite transporter (DMT)-like permease
MNIHERIRLTPAAEQRETRSSEAARAFDYALPVVFVLLWASGFVVPRAFAPYAAPFVFITARNAGAAVVLVLLALALRRPWPTTRAHRLGPMWGALQPAVTALCASAMVGEVQSDVR